MPTDRADVTALGDRMALLTGLRTAMVVLVVAWASLRPEVLGVPPLWLWVATAMYLIVEVGLELLRRVAHRRLGILLISIALLLDGLYLTGAMYVTGGTSSPMRFLIYLHLVAVSLLASYRTGLKLALWDSLLLFVVLYAQAAQLLPAVDVAPGAAIEFEQMPVLFILSFWMFALATCVFSAMNERELRNRRADLQTIVDIGARLDDESDPVRQSQTVLDGLAERFGYPRGVVVGASEEQMVVLATRGTTRAGTTATTPDAIVTRCWDQRRTLPVRRLSAIADPVLDALLPGAANVLVAPMVADGRPVGAVVVEHPRAPLRGVDRRMLSVLGQVCAVAALNLRNAVLLRNVQDLAERDSLTGAANRRMFQLSLERIIDAASHDRSTVSAVLFIDLDDFKVVNDSLGHATGDALLQAVTDRISASVRENDLVARLGGDEFAILTEDAPDLKRSLAMAERLVRELRAPYQLGERHVSVSASIGIATARESWETASDVVRNADVAMYMAKANGKAGFAVFDPGMHAAIRERHELGVQLQSAVELGQLRLDYQPIVDLADGRMAGVEALVRWLHPERGLVAPGEFIEIAEENGAILPIGRWILREACREAASWTSVDPSTFLCVNVSAREIQQPGFVDAVHDALSESGMAAGRLSLEITETALLRATPRTIETLESLRALGVRIVIDDFGTGYFSLSHLRQFPIDLLKIASEFVQGAEEDPKAAALAGAIVAMARSMGIGTVAEGIETVDQARRVHELGCGYGQGFHFAQPTPGAEVAAGAFAALVGSEPEPAAPTTARTRRARRPGRRAAAPAAVEERAVAAVAAPGVPVVFRAPFGGFARRPSRLSAVGAA